MKDWNRGDVFKLCFCLLFSSKLFTSDNDTALSIGNFRVIFVGFKFNTPLICLDNSSRWVLFLWFIPSVNNSFISFMVNSYPANLCLLKVSNSNIGKRFEVCSKLTIKTLERHQLRHSGALIVNCGHIHTFFCCFNC